jgi:hypothetical protein
MRAHCWHAASKGDICCWCGEPKHHWMRPEGEHGPYVPFVLKQVQDEYCVGPPVKPITTPAPARRWWRFGEPQ